MTAPGTVWCRAHRAFGTAAASSATGAFMARGYRECGISYTMAPWRIRLCGSIRATDSMVRGSCAWLRNMSRLNATGVFQVYTWPAGSGTGMQLAAPRGGAVVTKGPALLPLDA